MRVFIYEQSVPGDQECDDQEKCIRDWAVSKGHEIIGLYHEKVAGKSEERPILNQMFIDVYKSKADAIVISDIQRLMTSTSDAKKIFKAIIELGTGTSIIVVNQNLIYDKTFMEMYPKFMQLSHYMIGARLSESRKAAMAKGSKQGRHQQEVDDSILVVLGAMDKAGLTVQEMMVRTKLPRRVLDRKLKEMRAGRE